MSLASLVACGSTTNPPKRSSSHLSSEKVINASQPEMAQIPEIVIGSPYVPLPKPYKKPETYTVVVNEVPVKELLFAISRDANIDVDIVGNISGTVTLNAIDKTLAQILERIAQHTDIKYRLQNNYLVIEKDAPYLKTYHVDYVNIERNSKSSIELATQIASAGSVPSTGGASIGNNSSTAVSNTSINTFWVTLEKNLNQIVALSEDALKSELEEKSLITEKKSVEDGVLTTTTTREAETEKVSNVIVNKEAGIISVFTLDKNHKKILNYIDAVSRKARKQVLIEATIVEVELSDAYKSGVDWSVVNTSGTGLSLNQSFTDAGTISASTFTATLTDSLNAEGNVTATVKALEQFGDVQILSSPKVIAINNQMALIKVVDNRVYFTSTVEVATNNEVTTKTFRTILHTVPIGFVMNVTPSISQNNCILLNVRPTISRILNKVRDPNPDLDGVISEIPEIQVREMETLLRMNSGQTAIIGGLMQDKVEKKETGIPWLNQIPAIGFLFGSTEETVTKTELLVFIKATVVDAASVDNELRDYYEYLPKKSRKDHLSPSERVAK